MNLFRTLPLSLADALGRGLGRLYRFVDRRRRRLVARNLALAFPEKPAAEREAITQRLIAGRSVRGRSFTVRSRFF